MKIEDLRGKVLVLGDSITDDRRYLSYINCHLRLNNKNSDIVLYNLGVSSETISGLSETNHPFPRPCLFGRLDKALTTIKPDWVITMYGVNDAIYHPMSKDNFQLYQNAYIKLSKIVKEYGARMIILTPVPFDKFSYKGGLTINEPYGGNKIYQEYEEVMEIYSDWVCNEMPKYCDKVIDLHRAIATHYKSLYAHNPKANTGDGIHPNESIHKLMADTILQELFEERLQSENNYSDKTILKYCKLMQKRDNLVHYYYKELIGHDNIYKNRVLKSDKLSQKLRKLDTKIDKYTNKLITK